jgi:trimethylamine:corrinoid methyltransferase-like protein
MEFSKTRGSFSPEMLSILIEFRQKTRISYQTGNIRYIERFYPRKHYVGQMHTWGIIQYAFYFLDSECILRSRFY